MQVRELQYKRMSVIKIKIVDTLEEFNRSYSHLMSVISSVVAEHKYSLHPDYLKERMKSANMCVLINYSDEKPDGYMVFEIQYKKLYIMLSVVKLVSITVKQAIFQGFVYCNNMNRLNDAAYAVIVEFIRIYPSIKHLNMYELEITSPIYSVLNSRSMDYVKVYNVSAKKEINTFLALNSSFEEYLNGFKKKSRYNLTRNIKLFNEATDGDYELKKFNSESEVTLFYEMLDRIYKKTWQSATFGYCLRGNPIELNLAMVAAQKNWFRSYVLMLHNIPIAYVLGFQYGNSYYWDEIGFDSAYKELSPGSVLTYFSIEDIMSNKPPKYINFGYGENVYKKIYGNLTEPAVNLVLVRSYSIARLFVLIQITVNKLYILTHKVVSALRLDGYIRKILKHRTR